MKLERAELSAETRPSSNKPPYLEHYVVGDYLTSISIEVIHTFISVRGCQSATGCITLRTNVPPIAHSSLHLLQDRGGVGGILKDNVDPVLTTPWVADLSPAIANRGVKIAVQKHLIDR